MWPWSWPPGGSWTSPFSQWPGESVVWDEPPGEPGSSGESRESRESREESLWRHFGGSGRPPWAGHEWEMATEQPGSGPSRSTLLIAPGRRYRREGDDSMSGCDGTRSWHAVKENDTWSVVAAPGPEPPPMASMLQPSWLLTGFSLETGGSLTVSGRDALTLPRCCPGCRTARGARVSAVLATSSTRPVSASPPCTRSRGYAWAVRASTGSSRCGGKNHSRTSGGRAQDDAGDLAGDYDQAGHVVARVGGVAD